MNNNRFPICDREDCRFSEGMSTMTAMHWTPVYDKRGNLLNSNPNTSRTHVGCSTCGKDWMRVTSSGETVFEEIKR